MRIQKLSWAGLKIWCGDKCVLIDAVEDFSLVSRFMGAPKSEIFQFSENTKADYIVLTHLHFDHYSSKIIDKCLASSGKIICSDLFSKKLKKQGFGQRLIELSIDESYSDGGITFKPVFSMDGIGDEQVAWIVVYHDLRLIHCGDTIWHGRFWKIGQNNPQIDYAFLPVNGVIANFEQAGLAFSSIPASLTPEQAVNAGKLMKAKKIIPMHYQLFDGEFYRSLPNCEAEFIDWANAMNEDYLIMNDGDIIDRGNDTDVSIKDKP
ncbi:MAG: uncharacterized protein JWM28_3391 [Chitinophagaceae bacterium]|nr:uncharacterized protein [Chitinophagaceae bacterium]